MHSWSPALAALIGYGVALALINWKPRDRPHWLKTRIDDLAARSVSAAAQRQGSRVLELAKKYEMMSTESQLLAHVDSYPDLRREVQRLKSQPRDYRITALALHLAKKRVGIDKPPRSLHWSKVWGSLKRPPLVGQTSFDVQADYLGPHHRPIVVVFVHGLFGSKEDTWLGETTSFPSLLAQDPQFMPHVDVFLYEYYTPRFGNAGSIVELADQLRGSLDDHGVFNDHQRVVFVCHSMGGVVVRQFLLTNRDRLGKVAMLYFYATPTNGSELTKAAKEISRNPQLRGILPLEGNDLLQSIQAGWLACKEAKEIPSYCAFELLPILGTIVVSRSSATALCNQELDPIDANHIDIVKPKDRKDPRYSRFASAIRKSVI
jgi:hypothetical protein